MKLQISSMAKIFDKLYHTIWAFFKYGRVQTIYMLISQLLLGNHPQYAYKAFLQFVGFHKQIIPFI